MQKAKPFLKWAGGKTQLLNEIEKSLPNFVQNEPFTYIEPFVGSGAVLFWMLDKYPNLERAVINDINGDLINTYRTITNNPTGLIDILNTLQNEYHGLAENEEKKRNYYNLKRECYNTRESNAIMQSALFIFLNRTCFNGLYRVNRKNLFNVPIGSYKKPMICDAENILAVSEVLQRVEILQGDFEQTLNYATQNTLFYFDPPYKPLSNTASFNTYAKDEFNDAEQIRLRDVCKTINVLGHHWILSNSDVREENKIESFFDDIYRDFKIERVKARRIINANPEKRGKLNELLITNYKYEETLSNT